MNFLKNIADRAKTAADSPIRSVTGAGNSTRTPSSDGGGDQEGFLCPVCMTSCGSPEALHHHFEAFHSEADGQGQQGSDVNFRFGPLSLLTGLQRELTTGSNTTPSSTVVAAAGEEERQLLTSQIKALEESKTLLTSEVISLRQQLSQQNGMRGIEESKLLERANKLATVNVTLQAELDELQGEKSSLEEKLRLMETEESHRTCVEDASVLRQEVVAVQKAMDEALMAKEEAYTTLFYEKQKLFDEFEAFRKNHLSASSEDDMWRSEMAELELKLTSLEHSLATTQDQLTGSQAKLAELQHNCDSLAADNACLEERLREQGEEKDATAAELLALRVKWDQAQVERCSLEDRLRHAEAKLEESEKRGGELAAANGRLESRLAEAADIGERRSTDMEELKKKIQDLETETARLSDERRDLLGKIEAGEGSNLAIHQLTAQNTSLTSKIGELEARGREKEAEHEARLEALRRDLAEAKDQLATEKEASRRLNNKVDSLDKELAELQRKNRDLETEAVKRTEVMSSVEKELKEKLKRAAADLELANKERSLVSQEKKEWEGSAKKLEQKVKDLTDLMKVESEAKSKAQLEVARVTEASSALEALNRNLTEARSQLEADLMAVELERREVEQKMVAMTEVGTQDKENIRLLKEAKIWLEHEKMRLEAEAVDKEARIQDLGRVVAEGTSRITELESVIFATETKICEMREAIEAASGIEKSLLSDLEEKSKAISAIEEEKSSIATNLQTNQSIIERLVREKEEAEKHLQAEKMEREILEEQICSMQSKWEKEREKSTEELAELRTAREILLSQVVDLKEERDSILSSAEDRQKSLQGEVVSLQQRLTQSQAALEQNQLDLARERSVGESRERELQASLSSLQAECRHLTDTLTLKDKEVARQQQQLSSAAVDRDAALSRLLELEAAVAAAAEERRGLLERCLAAESETERSRNITLELRRKMDDSQAALHELGRENQSLQVELARQSGRKWKDDTEVKECNNCRQTFSLTVRKHHCRNCGSIFCNDCSAKQAIIDGSKKPQRVCNGCFSELGTK